MSEVGVDRHFLNKISCHHLTTAKCILTLSCISLRSKEPWRTLSSEPCQAKTSSIAARSFPHAQPPSAPWLTTSFFPFFFVFEGSLQEIFWYGQDNPTRHAQYFQYNKYFHKTCPNQRCSPSSISYSINFCFACLQRSSFLILIGHQFFKILYRHPFTNTSSLFVKPFDAFQVSYA